MLRYGDETTKAFAKKLSSDLFYETEHLLDPLVKLLRAYSKRQTLEYLGNCVGIPSSAASDDRYSYIYFQKRFMLVLHCLMRSPAPLLSKRNALAKVQ
jgi:hypothetical protein